MTLGNIKAPISYDDLSRFHSAAKLIEAEGYEGYLTVRRNYGADIAGALLVAFLRRNFGSMETYPAKPDIVEKTDEILKKCGLIL